ncbi:HNH endonuclease signature motif containing protein [Pseudarthrobacter chlorophenolicus]|uniref:HNH endonuclease signature motif containing protein n=1 Tax=Pseudarthrobacter chlorophenolicus TaxID=85085 RepID=UPI002ADE45B8|nr:HNH endonuclease signature motif containing protein [Pseudarthrobacter chlorophenolicus]
MRDGKCTFPGCSNHTQDNENDHLTAWQHGGATGISNLAQLCPKHHRLKHQSSWTPSPASKNEPPGWTSPTGRHYPAEQPDWVPPRLPFGLPAGRSTMPPNIDGGTLDEVGDASGNVSPLEDALIAYLAA